MRAWGRVQEIGETKPADFARHFMVVGKKGKASAVFAVELAEEGASEGA